MCQTGCGNQAERAQFEVQSLTLCPNGFSPTLLRRICQTIHMEKKDSVHRFGDKLTLPFIELCIITSRAETYKGVSYENREVADTFKDFCTPAAEHERKGRLTNTLSHPEKSMNGL